MARVLMVEDEREVADAIAEMLRSWGYDVTVVYDGTSAIQKFESLQPDLVLLDLQLPDISGVQVLKHIRTLGDVPVIVFTGIGDFSARAECMELGATDFLTKPISMDELLSRIRNLLPEELVTEVDQPSPIDVDASLTQASENLPVQSDSPQLSPDAVTCTEVTPDQVPIASFDAVLLKIRALADRLEEATRFIVSRIDQMENKLMARSGMAAETGTAAQAQVEELQQEIKNLKALVAERTLLLSTTRRELERELNKARQLLADTQNELDTARARIAELEKELAEAKEKNDSGRRGGFWRRR